jgi:lipopolysaccharide transport system permease protein
MLLLNLIHKLSSLSRLTVLDLKSNSDAQNQSGQMITYIEPVKGWMPLDLQGLWRYRDLLVFLCWRDVAIRYKQTVLGAGWAILQPVFSMVVFSILFGGFAKIPSDQIPYPIFSFVALLPWQYFSTAMTNASRSLVSNQALITKVYFPRLIIPLSGVLSPLVDFAVALIILILMMFFYHIPLTVNVIWLPLFLALAVATALATGLWLSALNVYYRDIQYTLPFLIQIWLFVSPIVYPTSLVPERWRLLYSLNPMVGVVDGFRWALLSVRRMQLLNLPGWFSADGFQSALSGFQQAAPIGSVLISTIVAIVLVISGAYYFRRLETTFADVV